MSKQNQTLWHRVVMFWLMESNHCRFIRDKRSPIHVIFCPWLPALVWCVPECSKAETFTHYCRNHKVLETCFSCFLSRRHEMRGGCWPMSWITSCKCRACFFVFRPSSTNNHVLKSLLEPIKPWCQLAHSTFSTWWSFPLFSWPLCLMKQCYFKENLDASHF